MIILVLLFSSVLQALAQMPLPEKVCIGTIRTYWVDGFKSSIYTWKINGIMQSSSAGSMGVTWNTIGVFKLELQEHQGLCDGIVQSGLVTVVDKPKLDLQPDVPACLSYSLPKITGINLSGIEAYYDNSPSSGGVKIKGPITKSQTVWIYDETGTEPNCSDQISFKVAIYDPPLAFAGDPLSICSGLSVALTASSAENYSSLLWTSTGDGLFGDPATLHAVYTPGANDLKAGSVTLTLTIEGLSSNTSCTPSVSSVEVTIHPMPLLLITNPKAVCAPATIDLTFSAITAGSMILSSSVFSYWRDEAATNALTGETVVSASGTYYIKLTSPGDCSDIRPVTVIIIKEVLPEFNPIGSLCLGSIPPVLPLTSTNGITGTWSPSVITTDLPGTVVYTFTADGVKCTDIVSMAIIVDPIITPLFEPIEPICLNSTAPVLPAISTNGITGTWSPAIVATDEVVRSYTFTPDLLFCADIQTLEIEVKDLIHVTIVQDKPIIVNGGKANLTAKVTGGSGNFSYLWNDPLGQTTATATNLSAVLYKVVVTDMDGVCDPVKASYELTEPQPFIVKAEIIQPIICLGGLAMVSVTATGGIPPYNGVGIYQVPAGQYQYNLTDYNLVVAKSNYLEVNEPEALKADVASVPISCGATGNGSITVTNPSGGSRIYQVRIDGEAWIRTANKIWSFTMLGPGSYPVQIRDASYEEDCIVTLETVEFKVPQVPQVPQVSGNGELTECQNSPYKALNANDGLVPVNGILLVWYDAVTGGNVVASPLLNTAGTITYYAEATNGTCASTTRTAVKLTINTIPEAPTASVTVQPTCTDPNGTIVVIVPQEGTGFEYSVDGGAYQSTVMFKDLISGTHQLKIRESATGYESAISTLTVNPVPALPDAPTASVTVQPTCIDPTGTIVVSLPKEGSGIEYSIDDRVYQPEVTFKGLKPGTHQLKVREIVNGCVSAVTSLTVNPAPVLQFTPAVNVILQPTCTVPTGTVAVTDPSEGTGYEYRLDGRVYQSAVIFKELIPGSHQITVRELATGCESAPGLITVNPIPVLQFMPTASVIRQPDCNVPTGTAVVTDPKEDRGFEYSIDKGAYQSANTFKDLIPGPHQFSVRETATGCESQSGSLLIKPIPELTIVPTAGVTVQPTCNVPTGIVVVTDQAEGTGFEYSMDGEVYQSTVTFKGLVPGLHQLRIRELVTGCESATTEVTINPVPGLPDVPMAGIIVQPTCLVPSGTLQISVPQEGTGFEYAIDGGVYQSTATFNGIIPGTHQLKVRDLTTGCESPSSPVTVNPVPGLPGAPAASVTTRPTCTVPTGTIVVTAPSEGSGFEYRIDGGVYQSDCTFNGLVPGSHELRVRELSTGCESAATLFAVDPIPNVTVVPTASVTIQPTCIVPTGTVVVSSPQEGTGFEYLIDGGSYQSTGTFNGLIPGRHQLRIRDLLTGCESVLIALTVNPVSGLPSAPTARVSVQPSCIVPSGTVVVTVPQEGTGFEYSLDGGVYQPGSAFPGLAPGSSPVLRVRDLMTGCESPGTTLKVNRLPQNPDTPLARVSSSPTCNNPDGTIEIISPVGSGYVYSLDGDEYRESPVFSGLNTNRYAIRVKNILTGCESSSGSIEVPAIPPSPVLNIAGVNDSKCFGDMGTISLSVSSVPDGDYSLQYENGRFEVNLQNGQASRAVPAGTYQNLLIEANGCVSAQGVNAIVKQPEPIVIKENVTPINLKSQTKGSIDLNVEGGNPDYKYLWHANAAIGFDGATGSTITDLNDGLYLVTVTDANGCQKEKTIIMPPPDFPPVAMNDDFNALCSGVSGNLFSDNGYGKDTDPENDQIFLELTLARNPSHGTVTLNPDQSGAFEYVSEPGYSGSDTFRYVISDTKKNLSNAALVSIHILADFDGDGIPDDIDQDADGDGILNVDEVLPGQDWKTADSDGDGHPNYLDIDSDNDGIVDNVEPQPTDGYLPPTGIVNQFGVDYAYDPAHGGKKLKPVDTDKDGIPDFLDADSDNDGVPDYIEGNDPNHDGHPEYVLTGKDTDADGLDDGFDIFDKCTSPATNMTGAGSHSPLQDTDGNDIPDWRDPDDDGDGELTIYEDLNGDGIWWDDDTNHNGIPEYLDPLSDCELFIPDAFSPNGDNIHDYFMIYCMQNYPNARMYVFDQIGNKLYEKDHYGNLEFWKTPDQAWWDGRTTNRSAVTITGMVEPGTYFYLLKLGNGEVRKNTVFVSY